MILPFKQNHFEYNYINKANHFADFSKIRTIRMNPQAPVAQKIADDVVFRRFQGEGVEFSKSYLTAPPPEIFDAHLLKKKSIKALPDFIFQWFLLLGQDHVLSQMVL